MDEKLTGKNHIYVCEANLQNGEMRGVKVKEQWLLIVRHQDQYYALDAACAHSGYPLFKGKLSPEGVITCGLHYAQFDCCNGNVVSNPAICENQQTFEIEVKEDKIFWVRK